MGELAVRIRGDLNAEGAEGAEKRELGCLDHDSFGTERVLGPRKRRQAAALQRDWC